LGQVAPRIGEDEIWVGEVTEFIAQVSRGPTLEGWWWWWW